MVQFRQKLNKIHLQIFYQKQKLQSKMNFKKLSFLAFGIFTLSLELKE